MLIDWFTVIAQIVNFLILVVLMKVFLYRPVLKAMDERERAIGERLAAAEAEREKAAGEAAAYREKNRDWTAEHEALQTTAKKEVETAKGEMLKQAHEAVAVFRDKWQASIEHQKAAFLRNLRRRVTHQVYATARKALRDLANRDLEEQMTTVFIKGLEAFDGDQWKKIGEALRARQNEIVVESAFEIAPAHRENIKRVLQAHLPQSGEVHYRSEPDFICGIALKVPGQKMAWDLNDYLTDLEAEISGGLRVETGTSELVDAMQ